MLGFLRTFADRCHHGKEESLLFPAMEAAGIPRQGALLCELYDEHASGRILIRRMAESESGEGLREAAGQYIELIYKHIDKEDYQAFPLADERLSAETQRQLEAGFSRADEALGRQRINDCPRTLDDLRNIYMAAAK